MLRAPAGQYICIHKMHISSISKYPNTVWVSSTPAYPVYMHVYTICLHTKNACIYTKSKCLDTVQVSIRVPPIQPTSNLFWTYHTLPYPWSQQRCTIYFNKIVSHLHLYSRLIYSEPITITLCSTCTCTWSQQRTNIYFSLLQHICFTSSFVLPNYYPGHPESQKYNI